MSFSSLRARRQSKESKSFVNTPSAAKEESTALVPTKAILSPASDSASSTGELLYSTIPGFLEVRTTSEDGRGIWTKQGIKRGAALLSVKPHIHVLSTKNLEYFCSACIAPAPESGLKRCTRCRVVWYCGATCQNNDWATHKAECSAMQRWAAGAPSPDVVIPAEPIRALGRLLWKKQKQGLKSIWAREVDQMQSLRKSLPPSATESHTHLAHAVIRYLGLNAPGELGAFGIANAADIVDVISRFTTNSFTLTSPSLNPLGVSVSPVVALINHSCDPNAVVVFPRSSSNPSTQEPCMQVVAIRDIAPGEQVFTAYIDTTLPKLQRQMALESTYSFKCKCTLCSEVADTDLRESVWCPKKCGGACPLPTEEDPLTRCRKCKAVVIDTDAVLDAARIGQEALDKANALQFSDLPKALQLTTNIAPILTSANLTPASHPLLSLTRLHQSLLLASFPPTLTQDALDTVIRAASSSLAGLCTILRPGHPIRALAIAELGKLLAVDEPSPATTPSPAGAFPPSGAPRLNLAYETLVKARAELMVGFGEQNEGGEVGKEVREMIVRVERELAAWKQGVKNVIEDTPALQTGRRR